MSAVAAESPLSHGDVLGLLLGVEGFLFAAITLAVTLAGPNQPARKYESLKPKVLLLGVSATLLLVGTGAFVSWGGLYLGGEWAGMPNAVEAVALLIAIVAQPVFAFLLTLAAMD